MFCKKGVIEDFAKFTEKHLCWSLFLIKLQAEHWLSISIALIRLMFPWKIFLYMLFFLIFAFCTHDYYVKFIIEQGSLMPLMNRKFSGVSKKYKMETLDRNQLNLIILVTLIFYKQLGSDPSAQSCLYLQGFQG